MPQIYPKATTAGEAAAQSSPRFPEIEELVLKYWDEDGTFQASIDARDAGADGANEFVFYDGPPFANGLPHYGHLLTGYAKDVFPRFQTMLGKKVDRVFGWDTHGLPAELEAMKQLGITEKSEIDARPTSMTTRRCWFSETSASASVKIRTADAKPTTP